MDTVRQGVAIAMKGMIEHAGCPLAYDVEGAGPPVLFIQGVGVHAGGWKPQTDPLSRQYTCLTFDNRGMGQSLPVGKAVTVAQMAEDALALMDAVGWDSAHVVGHSLGGLVSVFVALTARKRVRSLSLLCTFPSGKTAAPLTPRMIWLGLRSRVGTRGMRRRGFMKLVMPPGAVVKARDEERLAELFGHDLADQPPIVNDQLRAMRAANALPRLGELAGVPTLVVSAEHDPIAPPHVGQLLAKGIPGAEHIEIKGVSHGLPISDAEKLNILLEKHLTKAEAAWLEDASPQP